MPTVTELSKLTGIKGAIFDVDGTLVDSMPTHFIAWSKTAQKFGFDFPENLFYEYGGRPVTEILQDLFKQQNKDPKKFDIKEIREYKNELYHKIRETEPLRPIQKVLDILRAYKERGLVLAVATGNNRINVEDDLKTLKIYDWFQAIVCCEDYVHGKPAGDPYKLAQEKINVPVDDLIAFEDTDVGMRSIRAANIVRAVDIRTITQD